MHLTERDNGEGMSISELALKCEVEKEVVQSQMTYWIAKGVIKQRRGRGRGRGRGGDILDDRCRKSKNNTEYKDRAGDSDSDSNSDTAMRLANNYNSEEENRSRDGDEGEDEDEDEIYFIVIEEQVERAARDKEERPGVTGGADEDLGLVFETFSFLCNMS